MKRLLLLPLLLSSVLTFAHEGGHGPITDESRWSKPDRSPREGGVLMPVVLAAADSKGPGSELVYNAELVRAEDGGVKIYLYDTGLKTLRLEGLSDKAKGSVQTAKKGKTTKASFELTLDRTLWAYIGKAPRAAGRPYTVEVTFSDGMRKLSSVFDRLD